MPTEGKKGDEKTATEKSKDIHLEGKLKWPKLYKWDNMFLLIFTVTEPLQF